MALINRIDMYLLLPSFKTILFIFCKKKIIKIHISINKREKQLLLSKNYDRYRKKNSSILSKFAQNRP